MPLACRICIATNGLKGSDIAFLAKTEKELIEHFERDHHMPVVRPGETEDEADARFLQKYPEAKTCSKCLASGASWTDKP